MLASAHKVVTSTLVGLIEENVSILLDFSHTIFSVGTEIMYPSGRMVRL